KDQFHFTFDTEEYEQLSQSGIVAGYGAELAVENATPPREVIVAFVEPGSPAEAQGLVRGDRILRADNVDVVNGSSQADVDAINAALFPSASGEQHTFVVENVGDNSGERTISVTAAEITVDPVPDVAVINTANGPVGYVHFTTHIATAEAELISAINALAGNNVTELVLDLRYNGGGFLDIANELAYMVAGPAAAQGRVFDEIKFSDKHPSINPVTGRALAPDFFHTTSQGFSVTSGQDLPSLNLSRVFVLSGPGTCSASEAIINGLRGIDVDVVLIGEPTCGKPYGFFPFDNCGTTYFTIQFSGSNDKGFGDYPDGFIPVETSNPTDPTNVTGCVVADDFGNPLGDIDEARLDAALTYIETGSCPSPTNLQQATKSLPVSKSVSASSASAIGNGRTLLPGRIKNR
ncbi:MAG: S41 family peptidase, partial [Pseudomonadales bacterium]